MKMNESDNISGHARVEAARRYQPEDVEKAVATLKSGGLILYPTDTVWGIGCDATDAEAVSKILKLKQSDDAKSMLALVADEAMLRRWVRNVPETAYMLMEAAVDPLTIIYDCPVCGDGGIAANLTASDGSLGIRVCADSYCQAICRKLGRPLVSTSANISGQPTPGCYDKISEEIRGGVDYISAFRRDDRSKCKPSAIIKVTDRETIKVIR